MLDRLKKTPPAAIAFTWAAIAIIGMTGISCFMDDGKQAVDAIGGFSDTVPDGTALKLALVFDMLLPIGYGAGFCLLALDRGRGQPVTAASVCLFTALGALADFAENGAVAAGAPVSGFSFAKFGLLGIAVFLLGSLLMRGDRKAQILGSLAMIGTPVLLAVLMSRLLGGITLWVFLLPMIGMFALATYVSAAAGEGGAA